ncbi:hypothetical protein DRE_00442 [Drechslerella stenobrocha 248]|uniref:PQ-loop-domain-containing protein n=1 Tax=Drechslerella stenobrocha 248 TaxID=1043628 RepID=W7HVE5_9PEZI|nr:hypothetical protein DRE_00442 [Drechslerella stenobrocha 248]
MLLPSRNSDFYHHHHRVQVADGNVTSAVYPPSQTIALSIEAISGITGSVSIACWLVVFTPQIIENFKRGSAEGLSLTFLILWLLGDIFNVLGGILQGVIPTMLILAIYYTFADIVLIIQCFYYRAYARKAEADPQIDGSGNRHSSNARPGTADSEVDPTEESPLLSRTISDPYPDERRGSFRMLADSAHHLSPANPLHSLPPSRPSSSHMRKLSNSNVKGVNNVTFDDFSAHTHTDSRETATENTQQRVPSTPTPNKIWKAVLRNTIAISLVIFAGIAGYFLTPSHTHAPSEGDPNVPEHHSPLAFSLYGQIFGYLCAALYLGSRIPQIVLNYQRKSCEGVSFLFFVFACLGNVTYVISIVAYRPGRVEDGEGYWRYIAVNASWLLGSLGTLALDFVIFVQFFLYKNSDDEDRLDESAITSDDDEAMHP